MTKSPEQPESRPEMFGTIEQGLEVYESAVAEALKKYKEEIKDNVREQERRSKNPSQYGNTEGLAQYWTWARLDSEVADLRGMSKALGLSPDKIRTIWGTSREAKEMLKEIYSIA